MLGVTVAIISLCASALMAMLFIQERNAHKEEKKELMTAVTELYRQTNEIITESGAQHGQILALQGYVQTLEIENATLSRRNMEERQVFEKKIGEMKSKIDELERENKNLEKKVKELQTMILKINPQ